MVSMTNILRFDGFDGEEIRVTPDDRYSVYDVIKFCGKGNPRQSWKGLTEVYSEVVKKVDNYKFPGKGQRETPVANRQDILYIIGLLPGAFGRAYREDSARVFLQYLDASPELAESVIDRATPETLRRIQRRLDGKQIRVRFTHILQDHGVQEGWQFAACTNAIYVPLFGQDTKALRQSRGLPAKATPRDAMDSLELAALGLAEELSARNIEQKEVFGFSGCRRECADSAARVKKAIDGNDL
jgi:hypothetical protein